jgi:GTP-binding protein
MRLGARPGCAVTIGEVTFDWEPQTPSGVDTVMTRRGTDARLESTDRVGADERKAARRRRRERGSESLAAQRAKLSAPREASWSRSAPPR